MAPPMTVTILICTHQRADSLRRTLASVVDQASAGDAEVVVVDNGSTDDTAAVVASFPSVRYIYESRLGLCYARNRGWQEARAPIVAYLDDDALAAPGWLAAVRDAFSDGDPSVGCVGGPVLPDWEAPPPSWLTPDVSRALAIIDWPGERRHLTDLAAEWLAGANLACRITALQKVGGFHPWLDRRGRRLLSSGDVFLELQLLRNGYTCIYEPAMCVYHRIPAARLTRPWFRKRYFWQGVSDSLMEIIDHPSAAWRCRRALGRIVRLLARPRSLITLFRDTEHPQLFEEQCWTWIAIGQVAGLLGAGRQ
jgi:glycosyltransferase involved in cell wall biosynthesis